MHLHLVEEQGSELNRLLEVNGFQMDVIGPPSAKIDGLLNADLALALGYITQRPKPSTTPWHELPALSWRQPLRHETQPTPMIDTTSLITKAALLSVMDLSAADQLRHIAVATDDAAAQYIAPVDGEWSAQAYYVAPSASPAPTVATPVAAAAQTDEDSPSASKRLR